MENSAVEKIAAQLAEIRYENRISPTLYNEPLLDEALEDKVRILRDHLPWATISLNSNVDRLRRERLESLSNAEVNYICIILHPQPYRLDPTETLTKRIRKVPEKNTGAAESGVELDRGYIELSASGLRLKGSMAQLWRFSGTDRGRQVKNYFGTRAQRV